MTPLHELIDELYRQTMAEAAPVGTAAASCPLPTGSEPGARVQRLRRVLDEMGERLTADDQLRLDDVAPPTEEICLRILTHWQQLTQSIEGIREHEQSLEADIARMQPWGDFDVMKVEQLAERGVHICFWRVRLVAMTDDMSHLDDTELQLCPVSQDAEWAYYVTIGTESSPKPLASAERVEICPCPVSTLIMLQTRDKDARRRLETLRDDYALAHYGEMYAALRQALPPGSPLPLLRQPHRGLRQRIREMFGKGL